MLHLIRTGASARQIWKNKPQMVQYLLMLLAGPELELELELGVYPMPGARLLQGRSNYIAIMLLLMLVI